jgi:hypothetical protein
MEAATQDYLRQAAMDALSAKADTAAFEILAMLNGQTTQVTTARAVQLLPSARPVTDGPAHDYHFWAQFIRENFIPFMTGNGRLRFTSPELFTWIENCTDPVLTTGDLEPYSSGNVTWRNIASNALGALKKQGVITAPAWGKEYEIQSTRLLEVG